MKYHPSQFDYAESPLVRIRHLIARKVPFEIKEIRNRRTNRQNRYLHLAFRQVELYTGYTIEEVKQVLFKKICNPCIFIRHGENGDYLRSTSELDTGEMTKAINTFRDYCSSEIGLYIPEPNEEEKINAWEAELSRYGNHG